MLKNKQQRLWWAVLFGVTVIVLLYAGYIWKISTEEVFKMFDETEFIKTHYAGVDCSSLSGLGSVPRGDMFKSAGLACLAERAWFENDIKFCYYDMDYPNNNCLMWMAIKLGDLKICELQKPPYDNPSFGEELLEEGKPRAWLYMCYSFYAMQRDEPAICNLIPYAVEDVKWYQCIKLARDGDTYLKHYDDYSPIW